MSEMTTAIMNKLPRATALAAAASLVVGAGAAEAKKPNKVLVEAHAATANRPIEPANIDECLSAASGSTTNIVVKARTPKSPIVTFEARGTDEQCDDLAATAGVSARYDARITLSEKLGKNNWMPIGRVVLKNAPLFPLGNGNRDVDAIGKMRLREPMCEGPKKTYKLESAVMTMVEDGTPLGITPIIPTRLHREAPVVNEVDTVGPPVENPTIADLGDDIRYADQTVSC